MKKIVTSIVMLAIMLTMALGTSVNAATTEELVDKIYSMGQEYGLTSSDKVRLERFLADNPVTEAEADSLIAKAEEAVAVMENAGATSVKELSQAEKNELQGIAKEAASIVGVNLVFKAGTVEIYKDGKLIESISNNYGKLAYTGNNISTVAVVSLVAIFALAIGLVFARRRVANA